MKIREIYVQAEFKRSLANYQNVTFTAGCGADVLEDDDIKECYSRLWDMCGDQINEQLREFNENNKK